MPKAKRIKTGSTTKRQLHRPKKGKILGGVCIALANYFDVNPTLVRLGVIVLVVLTGPLMLIPYILAWVLIPGGK